MGLEKDILSKEMTTRNYCLESVIYPYKAV